MSGPVRLAPIKSDHMEPGLRRGRDAVLYIPTDRYHWEGLYVFDFGGGDDDLVVYRCQRLIGRHAVQLISDSTLYGGPHDVTKAEFGRRVRGKVVAEIRATDCRPNWSALAGSGALQWEGAAA